MIKSYDVDANGDLLIILPSIIEEFAPWNDSDDELTTLPGSSEDIGRIVDSQTRIDDAGPSSDNMEPQYLHFKVSSKHLNLASRRFERMLTGDWKEAKTIHEDGYRHVTLDSGFDPDALILLLNIIHGKTRKVPRSLDLEMLAKLSVLVDDFECYEEVEVFVDIWLGKLSYSPSTGYCRDLVLWILVSSVFHMSELFEITTCAAIWHSTGPIETLGLPIRDVIVAKIDEERQELLSQLMEILNDVLNTLCQDQKRCGFECDSMLLGAIIGQLYPHNLIWPKPSKPFIGFGLAESIKTICGLKSPVWCDMSRQIITIEGSEDQEMYLKKKKKKKIYLNAWDDVEEEAKGCPPHACSLQDLLITKIDRLKQSVKGLDLEKI